MPVCLQDHWGRRAASSPFYATASFDGEGLVLGSNTVLYGLSGGRKDTVSLHIDAAHDRMVALLSIAGRGRLAKEALLQLDAALGGWRRGNHGLAAIRLAFAPLPRLRDRDDAYGLFLAETALDAGMAPHELLREIGYFACAPLLKFDPSQPRVPAGSGAPSGRWTSGSASTDATGTSRPAPPPARPADAPQGFIPVFLRPQPDGEDEVIQDKERRLGFGETEEERILEGKPLLHPPVPGPGPLPPRDSLAPGAAEPEIGAVPVPNLKPAPGGNGSPSSDDTKDGGPACPKQENDISRGPNPNSDLFEYFMSILVNPDNPTPKNSPLTPDVTSQAYFLPSPAPTGRTSFDDCKQTGVPPLTPIPGLRPADMLEYKSPWWSWIIFNEWTSGFIEFGTQVKNQSDAVALEGRGRQVFYCMGDQAAATEAAALYGDLYKSSHFLVCH